MKTELILSEKPMIGRYEQVDVFSADEYQRRVNGVRHIMRNNNIDLLIFLECAEEAYDQWLTGRRMLQYMLVASSGDLTGTLSADSADRSMRKTEDDIFSHYRIHKDAPKPYSSLHLLPQLTGRELAERVAAHRPQKIGYVLPENMTKSLADALAGLLPGVQSVDVSMEIALFRAVKSEEEYAAVKQSRDIQVNLFEAFPQIIRPGRNMRDISNELHYLMMCLGSANVVHAHLVCYGPQNEPAEMRQYDDRTVEYGDRFFALMEGNGPGGQHICFGRCLTLGEPTKELVRVYDACTAVHKFAVNQMYPGTTLRHIAAETKEYAAQLGYELKECVGWNWMHSLGGYYYEQYSLEDYTDNQPLQADILLHCHPLLYREFSGENTGKREELFVLNAYRITEHGPQDLIGLPFGLYVIE